MAEPKILITRDDELQEVAVVSCEGSFPSFGSAKGNSDLEGLISDSGCIYIVMNFSELSDLAPVVMGELMGHRSRLRDRGGDIVLAGLGLTVREKLTAMDGHKIFKIFASVSSALNAFRWEYYGKSDTIELSFPSCLSFVPSVRSLLSHIAQKKGYGQRDSFRIETIVDEVCNNAVEHGLDGGKSDIDLNAVIDRTKIEIKVVNTSDPEKINSLRDIQEHLGAVNSNSGEKRGRGLALVKMLSSDFSIEHGESGTCVHVTKLREE